MLQRFQRARLLWPTVLATVGFCVLVALGNWQWQRMHWKDAVLEKLRVAEAAEPRTVGAWYEALTAKRAACPGPECATLDQMSAEFEILRLDGATRPGGRIAFVYAPERARQTYRVFEEVAGPTGAMVDFGIVDEAALVTLRRGAAGEARAFDHLVLVRHGPGPQFYTPAPDREREIWFSVPPRPLNQSGPAGALWFQVVRRAGAPAVPESAPQPPSIAQIRERIPNRHLEYALTWWGLAGGLALVFVGLAVARLRAATG
ncbi:MAG: SURF1 family cytochrome oxidase biogenesis protein [Pseudomonadota bacterium]